MSRTRDAVLAGLLLAVTLGVAGRTGTRPALAPLLAGAGGAIGLELLATRYATSVRAAWRRPVVQAASVAVGLALVALAAIRRPTTGLNALAGGLLAYLGLLALAGIGLLEVPTEH